MWPVLFLYPEYGTSDLIESFNEHSKLVKVILYKVYTVAFVMRQKLSCIYYKSCKVNVVLYFDSGHWLYMEYKVSP